MQGSKTFEVNFFIASPLFLLIEICRYYDSAHTSNTMH